ncbi:MAG: hypothetical protein CMJ49_03790 [Planctomycetaceae bacterium]|nr:hypothetical protein [Planctomycetaceae bacterium]
MPKPTCQAIPKTKMQIDGPVGDYVQGVKDHWLKVAPKANPGMLEMFRDRDAAPLRQMVPWAGEFAGKYLTSAVEVLRVTGDPDLKAWIKTFVDRLISLQAADGYLGPWAKAARLTNSNLQRMRTWDTWGHYHVMLGLILWHEETRDADALSCAARIADLICRKYLGNKKPRLVETGDTEMNLAPVHALCILYRKTKTQRYLKMAMQIVDEFPAKAKGRPLAGDYLSQALQGVEFFKTPKPRWESLHPIMALAELYWITGEQKYRTAFEQIWWSIVKLDRHNNGGFTSGEQAQGDPYHFGAIESCCTIAWTAMSVEMLKLTGQSVVADEIELSVLNSIVGMHTESGRWATYNTPMNGVRCASAHTIVFQAREGTPELNCCSVNTPRGFGMLSAWALMKDADGLLVNYYGPSTQSTKLKPGLSVTLTQETDYPRDGRVTLRVKPSKPAKFAIKLRIPYWSKRNSLKCNGQTVRGIRPGQYAVLQRKWKPGDRIELALDMSLHVWTGQRGCRGLASIYRGPILLTYDHRYNLEHAPVTARPRTRDTEKWNPRTIMMDPPTIDLTKSKPKPVKWDDWHPPILLFEFAAQNGKRVRLCDFGSAGDTGTPYRSWLPIKNTPKPTDFSPENPLRSAHI